jgi:2-hydroxychromene-2-carboxylate isomerase
VQPLIEIQFISSEPAPAAEHRSRFSIASVSIANSLARLYGQDKNRIVDFIRKGEFLDKVVDYYLSVASPWTYLGSARFIDMVRRHGVTVNVMPVELSRIFASSGGLLYENRAPQRRAYRQLELARWSRKLNVPLTLTPRFYPVDRRPASCLLIAARRMGLPALELSHSILRAIWHEEKDIADWQTLNDIATQLDLDGRLLVEAARDSSTATQYEQDTDLAIKAQVFGAPSYVINGELFWGQDRLDFVDEKLMS